MKKWLGFLGVLLFSGVAVAQTTIVVGVATDSDSTLWANGTISAQFVPNPAQPNLNVYRINGAPLSSAVTMQGPISLDSGGSFSVTVYDNTQITPSGSQWQFTVCPNAISKCGSVTTAVSGVGQSITTAIDAAIPAPRFPATAGSYGYADVEAILSTPVGGTYWNVANFCQRYYNGSSWSCGALPTGCVIGGSIPISCGGTGAATAAGANLNITGVTQTGTINTPTQVSNFPGATTVGGVSLPTNAHLNVDNLMISCPASGNPQQGQIIIGGGTNAGDYVPSCADPYEPEFGLVLSGAKPGLEWMNMTNPGELGFEYDIEDSAAGYGFDATGVKRKWFGAGGYWIDLTPGAEASCWNIHPDGDFINSTWGDTLGVITCSGEPDMTSMSVGENGGQQWPHFHTFGDSSKVTWGGCSSGDCNDYMSLYVAGEVGIGNYKNMSFMGNSWDDAPGTDLLYPFEISLAGYSQGTLNFQYVGVPMTLSGASNSGLAVTYSSSTTAVCTVASVTVTFLTPGTCTIQATQSGNGTYGAAAPVVQSFSVYAAPSTPQTITFANPGTQAGAPLTLVATTTAIHLSVYFSSLTASTCYVWGTEAYFVGPGTCTIQAAQNGNTQYEAATPVNQSFTVSGQSQLLSFGAVNPTDIILQYIHSDGTLENYGVDIGYTTLPINTDGAHYSGAGVIGGIGGGPIEFITPIVDNSALTVNSTLTLNSYQDSQEISSPSNPAATFDRWWFDSSTHQLECHTSSGSSCLPSGSLSGMTAGQVPLAATASTITSSKVLAGTGAGITTGPTTTTLNDCVKFGDTAGTLADAGAACGSGGGLTLTTTGSSGAATYSAGTLNIPIYSYTLPAATSSILGGVKPDGTTIANSSGAISVAYGTTGSTAAQGNDSRIVGAAQCTAGTTGSDCLQLSSGLVPAANLPTGTISTQGALKLGASGGADVYGAAAAVSTTSIGAVPTSTTVNGHALSSNVTVSASDLTTGTLPHAQLPTLLSGDIPNNAANTSGTAANLSGTPALPNGTTATTQTAGDNSTKLATTAYVATAVTNGAYALPSQYKIWSCEPGLGDGLNAIPAGTYVQDTCVNVTGASVTLTSVKCHIVGGSSSTMNASGNTLGALLTGAITCSTYFASGTQSSNVVLTNGDYVHFTFVADGTAKQTTWLLMGTY